MKDNAQETIGNYNGNARPGEIVADLTQDPPTLYIGNNLGQLTLLNSGGGGYGNTQVGQYLAAGLVGNIIPAGNSTYSLGSSTNWWSNVWVAGNTLYLGGVPLGMSGNTLTVNGAPVGGGNASLPLANGTSNINIATANGNVTITANAAATWTFDDLGNLTTSSNLVVGPAPGGGSSILQYDSALQVVGEGANAFVVTGWAANTNAPDSIAVVGFNSPFGNGANNVQIVVGNNATTVNYWTFSNDGNLNLPNNGSINFNAGGIVQAVDEDFTILVQDADDDGFRLNLNVDDGAGTVLSSYQQQRDQFGLEFPVTGKYYQFNDDGLAVFPGNINGAFGESLDITLPGAAANSFVTLRTVDNTDTLRSNVTVGLDNVTISTATASKTWTFDNTGVLTLPGTGTVANPVNSSLDPILSNVSTVVLTPDGAYSSQALVLDPTSPGHIHLRAPSGGNIDQPIANIFLGGEISSFEVGASYGDTPNVFIHSGGNTWTFDTTGNLILPDNTFAVKYANGATVSLGGAGSYGNANVADFLNSFGSNAIVTTGNITGGNLVSSATIFGNPDLILGNTANSTATRTRIVTDTTFSYIQTGNGTVGSTGNIVFSPYASATQRVVIDTANGDITANGTVRGSELTSTLSSGNEGGQINLAVPAANTTLGGSFVTVDVWQNRFRIFEGSANAKGAYIDLANCAAGVGTNLVNRASIIAGANTAVTLDNIQARVGGSPTRLYINTVSGNLTGAGQSQTLLSGSTAVSSWINVPIGQGAGNAFAMSGALTSNGDTAILSLIDQGSGSGMWRITGMIANTTANLYGVTIERLV